MLVDDDPIRQVAVDTDDPANIYVVTTRGRLLKANALDPQGWSVVASYEVRGIHSVLVHPTNPVVSSSSATIGGGSRHENHGIDGTIGGRLRNTITADFATVGGGRSNEAAAGVATIAGGGEVTIDFGDGSLTFAGNRVFGIGGTVGGGSENVAGTDHGDPLNARHATVGGGDQNTSSGPGSTVGGGLVNTAGGRWRSGGSALATSATSRTA